LVTEEDEAKVWLGLYFLAEYSYDDFFLNTTHLHSLSLKIRLIKEKKKSQAI